MNPAGLPSAAKEEAQQTIAERKARIGMVERLLNAERGIRNAEMRKSRSGNETRKRGNLEMKVGESARRERNSTRRARADKMGCVRNDWRGVFPAITTQMKKGGALDVDATAAHVEVLLASGVSGIVFLGSLGENQSLRSDEKRLVMKEMISCVRGRVPVLSGVAETSTAEALGYARDCERLGVGGLMLMPPMVYKSADPRESFAHVRTVARATGLPIMIYNNPLAYGHDLTPQLLGQLADEANCIAVKESSGDPRRITDLRKIVGDRYAIFTGVDDLILESAILGIDGWVAGTGIAFPRENQHFWELTRRGKWGEAREMYRWFTPLLHLDTHPKFVQAIKLAVQECGLGTEWTRPPRLSLVGDERKRVLQIIHEGIATRPKLTRRGG